MVRSIVRVQNIAVLIGDVQERTFLTEGKEVSSVTCTVTEENSDEDVTKKNMLSKETRLVGKVPVALGSIRVVFERDEEVVPNDDVRGLILFRAKHFEVLDVGLLEEDVNIEADFDRVYYSDQLTRLYGIVAVVAVYDVKENRKNSIKFG